MKISLANLGRSLSHTDHTQLHYFWRIVGPGGLPCNVIIYGGGAWGNSCPLRFNASLQAFRGLETSENRLESGAFILGLGFPFWSEICYFPFQWFSLPTFEGDNVLLILCPLDELSTLSSCSESCGLTLLSTSPRPPGPQCPGAAMAGEEEEKEMGHFLLPSPSTEFGSSCFSFCRRVLSPEPDLTGLPVVTNIVLSILPHLCMQSLHKSPSFEPSGVSWHGESKRNRAASHKHREQMYRHQWGEGVEDEWGDWDSHVYTIDAMYKMDN